MTQEQNKVKQRLGQIGLQVEDCFIKLMNSATYCLKVLNNDLETQAGPIFIARLRQRRRDLRRRGKNLKATIFCIDNLILVCFWTTHLIGQLSLEIKLAQKFSLPVVRMAKRNVSQFP